MKKPLEKIPASGRKQLTAIEKARLQTKKKRKKK